MFLHVVLQCCMFALHFLSCPAVEGRESRSSGPELILFVLSSDAMLCNSTVVGFGRGLSCEGGSQAWGLGLPQHGSLFAKPHYNFHLEEFQRTAPFRLCFNSNNLPEHEAWTSDAHAKPPNECTEKCATGSRMQCTREAVGKLSPTDAPPWFLATGLGRLHCASKISGI